MVSHCLPFSGRALFRSGSMDSLSTAVSLQTHHSVPTHSSSLIDLHLASENGIPSSARVESGKSCVLLDTGATPAILPGGAGEERAPGGEGNSWKERDKRRRGDKGSGEERRREKGEQRLTQSLPAAVERRIEESEGATGNDHLPPRPRSEPDTFSDNFISPEDLPLQVCKLPCSNGQ